jgi:ABC-type nitrate/sulfonate/bicarbonate transport system substrate-binding protein
VAITSRLAGAETVIVAASSNTVEFQIYGAKGITSFNGLRGKTVASGSKGSGGEIGMIAALQYAGLMAGKDLNVIYIGNSNDRAVVASKRIAAMMMVFMVRPPGVKKDVCFYPKTEVSCY